MGFCQGLEVGIDAMDQLHDRLPDLCLVFIGDGSRKAALEETVRQRGLQNVRFLPPHSPEYITRLLSFATAGFVSLKGLPLFDGAVPSKVFPIMATGKPVLYSGAGEGARLVQSARAGIVSQPEDCDALAAAIRCLVQNPTLADKLGRNGRQHAEKHLAWSALVGAWLRELEERLAEGPWR